MDISVSVARLPGPGETILGGQAVIAPGGKGANQAVAAARLGAGTAMAGCVGEDEFGAPILLALAAEGIAREGVRRVPGVATGVALITAAAAGPDAPGGSRYAVVTAGSHGAALAGPDGTEQVPGFAVASVDAVGAGDAFVAALAVGLAAGAAPADALRAACAAGATATTR